MRKAVFDAVHLFWFGLLPYFDSFNDDRLSLWFGGARDGEIAARFEAELAEANDADIDIAALSPSHQVALVVLFDQFPRNIFRGQAQSYAYDEKARAVADIAIEGGMGEFKLIERAFLTICLGHSEALADQTRALEHYLEDVAPFAPVENRFYEAGRIQTAKYLDIIQRFGRFPHRNDILGRRTTDDEAEFLAENRMAPF